MISRAILVRARLALGLLSAAGLLLAAPVASASSACVETPYARTAYELPTLNVTVAAERARYRRGQVAVVPVQVRLADPNGPKVGHAQVTIVISARGRELKKLNGWTNGDGTSRPRWKIGAHVPTGKVTAVATASVLTVDSYDCSGGLVYQTGRGTADPLTTVAP
ncbi:MAG: hypothetical protein M3P04_12590 [Actinomycetota bacterium]|nr:hypothetical protein [Actinomycetota bacterium]